MSLKTTFFLLSVQKKNGYGFELKCQNFNTILFDFKTWISADIKSSVVPTVIERENIESRVANHVFRVWQKKTVLIFVAKSITKKLCTSYHYENKVNCNQFM
jgi:hypothetical protein